MRLLPSAVLAVLITSGFASSARAQSYEKGGDPGPRPHPDCKMRVIDYGDMPKFPDVEVQLDRYYWDCPEDHPQLTQRQARSETRKLMIHVAFENIDQGAYSYGVKSCKRQSRFKFNCVGYFDAEGHIRCSQRYRVYRDGNDSIRSSFVASSTRCAESSKAKY